MSYAYKFIAIKPNGSNRLQATGDSKSLAVMQGKNRQNHLFGLSFLVLVSDEVLANRTRSSIPIKRYGAVGDVTDPEFSRR